MSNQAPFDQEFYDEWQEKHEQLEAEMSYEKYCAAQETIVITKYDKKTLALLFELLKDLPREKVMEIANRSETSLLLLYAIQGGMAMPADDYKGWYAWRKDQEDRFVFDFDQALFLHFFKDHMPEEVDLIKWSESLDRFFSPIRRTYVDERYQAAWALKELLVQEGIL